MGNAAVSFSARCTVSLWRAVEAHATAMITINVGATTLIAICATNPRSMVTGFGQAL